MNKTKFNVEYMIKYISTLLNILWYLYIKAFDLPDLGQPKRNKSMSKKGYWKSISWATLSKVRITNPFKQKGGKKVPNYYNNCKLSVFSYIVEKIQECLRTRNSVRIFNFAGDLRADSDVLFKNSGNPDYWKIWGFGKIVVRKPTRGLRKGFSLIATRRFSLLGEDPIAVKLKEIDTQVENFTKTGKKVKGLSSFLKIPKFLEECYRKIKLSEKKLAVEFHKINTNGVNKAWFENVSKRIVKGDIVLRPIEKKVISKSQNNEYPLEIVFPRDRIIYEALKRLLEIIFEKTFDSVDLHNSRSKKTRCIALNQIYTQMNSARWFIKGSISKCYNSADHDILISKLTKIIDDQPFVDLVYKVLKRKPHASNTYHSRTDLIQEKIVNSILFNIYLHDFDHAISEGFNKNKKLKWVRHADNFLIGIAGSKDDCLQIQKRILEIFQKDFKLILNLKKIEMTHASTDGVYFLGYNIYTWNMGKDRTKNSKALLNSTNKIVINAPIKEVIKRLALNGYCKNSGNPTRCGRLVHEPLHEIISKYLTLQQNLFSYYSMASNYKQLAGRIHYILKYSCALTFASKLKLKTLKKVFKKFGRDLTVFVDEEKKRRISYPKHNEKADTKFFKS
uniref:Reverse transcriptase domain-containing protein n=1 Tax=Grateloupia filicina TaxID=31455 RepID=A0A343WS81_9FLOR|nr:hypothetical protein [Grateloupia filicina]AWD77488.1 hypothetical protein [Grateloupia filicina]